MKQALVSLRELEKRLEDLDNLIEPNVKDIDKIDEKITHLDKEIKLTKAEIAEITADLQTVENQGYQLEKDIH